jgi:hypothetical protein
MGTCEFETVRDQARWREIINSFHYKDFYQSWDFHALSEKNGEGEPVMLFMSFGNNDAVALPFLLREGHFCGYDVKDASSVYGYSGPIVRGTLSDKQNSLFTSKVLEWLNNESVVTLFTRLNPLIDTLSVSEALGEVVSCGQTVPIDLSLPLDVQRKQYRQTNRSEINKLVRMGAECMIGQSTDNLNTFIDLYESTMDRLGADSYYHFERGYYKDLLEADDFTARLYVVSLNGDIICGGIFVFDSDIVQYHLGGTNSDYYKLAPTKLMFDKVRLDANDEGKRWFHLGGGAGSKEDSLYKFKAGFSKVNKRFSVLKVVVNKDRYEKICSACMQHSKKNGLEINNLFFPIYRSIKSS